jgi:hypothetical protein
MNEASLSPRHTLIRAILVFAVCTLLGSVSIQPVKADAALPPDPTVGGVGPYQPQKTNVQMMSETVFIDVPYSPPEPEQSIPISVNASFAMRNQGQTEEQMQVIFPLSRLGYDNNPEQSVYLVDLFSFVAEVNGKPVPISQIATPAEIPEDYSNIEHGFTMEVLWAAFPVTFPVQQDVLLQVEYEMVNQYAEIGADFTGVDYILEAGAGWYGNILSADIIVRLPYLAAEEALRYVQPGYTISGKELHWTLKNFEPTREDNLWVRIVRDDVWRTILELQSKVKQNPNDAEAWDKLAGWYRYFSIDNTAGSDAFPYYLNHRTADLAVESYRKVVDLSPESGDAHFLLAEILWYTNPKVEAIWGPSSNRLGSIPPDDPSIQEVLHELELARSYGLSDNIKRYSEKLVAMINITVPGLGLASPTASTAKLTIVPSTETLTPTATETPPPTASPTFTVEPVVSLTPVPTMPLPGTTNVLLIVALGLIGVGAASIYLLKSKM